MKKLFWIAALTAALAVLVGGCDLFGGKDSGSSGNNAWVAVQSGGTADTTDTAKIVFTFDRDVKDLAVGPEGIIISKGTGEATATPAALTPGSDLKKWEVPVTTLVQGTVKIKINKKGISPLELEIPVYKKAPSITWKVKADGSPATTTASAITSTKLIFEFSADIPLQKGHIEIAKGADGGEIATATAAALEGLGRYFTLDIAEVKKGGKVKVNINSTIANTLDVAPAPTDGDPSVYLYTIGWKAVANNVPATTTAVALNTTTHIAFTLDEAVPGLALGDLTFTNTTTASATTTPAATDILRLTSASAFTASSDNKTYELRGFDVIKSGYVDISISKKVGKDPVDPEAQKVGIAMKGEALGEAPDTWGFLGEPTYAVGSSDVEGAESQIQFVLEGTKLAEFKAATAIDLVFGNAVGGGVQIIWQGIPNSENADDFGGWNSVDILTGTGVLGSAAKASAISADKKTLTVDLTALNGYDQIASKTKLKFIIAYYTGATKAHELDYQSSALKNAPLPFTKVDDIPTPAAFDFSVQTGGKLYFNTFTVTPSAATNQTIVWSVKSETDISTTTKSGFSSGTTFTAGETTGTTTGSAIVTATVAGGLTTASAFTKDFVITITPLWAPPPPPPPAFSTVIAGETAATDNGDGKTYQIDGRDDWVTAKYFVIESTGNRSALVSGYGHGGFKLGFQNNGVDPWNLLEYSVGDWNNYPAGATDADTIYWVFELAAHAGFAAAVTDTTATDLQIVVNDWDGILGDYECYIIDQEFLEPDDAVVWDHNTTTATGYTTLGN